VGVRIRELAELERSDVGLESELSRISGARGSELRRTRLGIRSEKRVGLRRPFLWFGICMIFPQESAEISCSLRSLGSNCLSLVLWSRMEW
jgi:hypothetical protein